MEPEIEQAIYRFDKHNTLSDEQIDILLRGAPENLKDAKNKDDLSFRACLWAYYRRSREEAHRLGFTEHPELSMWQQQRPAAVLEVIKPDPDPNPDPITQGPRHFTLKGFAERVEKAAQKYGLLNEAWEYRDPDTMWDIIAWRREGDAVIFLVGDDRDYTHIIGVVWSPMHLQHGEIPHAIL